MISLPSIPISHIIDIYVFQTIIYIVSMLMMFTTVSYIYYKKYKSIEYVEENDKEDTNKKYNTHFYIDLNQLL